MAGIALVLGAGFALMIREVDDKTVDVDIEKKMME